MKYEKYQKEYYRKNRIKRINYQKNYYSDNKENILDYQKEYTEKNKEIIKNKQKQYRNKNKIKASIYHKEYMRNQIKINSNFRLLSNLRNRIRAAIKQNIKSDFTKNLLGCSIEQLKNHLQQTAINNGYKDFDINNYNGKDYHIDHVVPCSSFDLSKKEQQRTCFNFKNLQILTAKENLEKSGK